MLRLWNSGALKSRRSETLHSLIVFAFSWEFDEWRFFYFFLHTRIKMLMISFLEFCCWNRCKAATNDLTLREPQKNFHWSDSRGYWCALSAYLVTQLRDPMQEITLDEALALIEPSTRLALDNDLIDRDNIKNFNWRCVEWCHRDDCIACDR